MSRSPHGQFIPRYFHHLPSATCFEDALRRGREARRSIPPHLRGPKLLLHLSASCCYIAALQGDQEVNQPALVPWIPYHDVIWDYWLISRAPSTPAANECSR